MVDVPRATIVMDDLDDMKAACRRLLGNMPRSISIDYAAGLQDSIENESNPLVSLTALLAATAVGMLAEEDGYREEVSDE